MSGDGWNELLGQLDEDTGAGDDAWGQNFPLEVGTIFTGWWRAEESWSGKYGETPVHLLRDRDGVDVFIWGGRAQLDNKVRNAALQEGDRIAIRREEDAPPTEPGYSPAWRVRVAVMPGEGSMPPAKDTEETDVLAADPDFGDEPPF